LTFFKCKVEESAKSEFITFEEIWRYIDADFERAKAVIEAVDCSWTNILPEDELHTAALLWQQKFLDIMNKCVPTQFLTRKKRLP